MRIFSPRWLSSYSHAAQAQFQRSQALNSAACIFIRADEYLKACELLKLNKKLEERTVDQFVKRLDGSKLYCSTKTSKRSKNMAAFSIKPTTKMRFDREANQMFVKRVEERVAYAKKYLGPKFKYDPKASIQRDPQDRPRPKSMAEANKFHETYMQYQVATYLATDMKLEEAKAQIVRNYERALKRVQDFKKEDLYSSYLDSFARALDPHSSYLSADALEDFEIQMRLSLEESAPP